MVLVADVDLAAEGVEQAELHTNVVSDARKAFDAVMSSGFFQVGYGKTISNNNEQQLTHVSNMGEDISVSALSHGGQEGEIYQIVVNMRIKEYEEFDAPLLKGTQDGKMIIFDGNGSSITALNDVISDLKKAGIQSKQHGNGLMILN